MPAMVWVWFEHIYQRFMCWELGLQDSGVEVVGSPRRGTLQKVLGYRGTVRKN